MDRPARARRDGQEQPRRRLPLPARARRDQPAPGDAVRLVQAEPVEPVVQGRLARAIQRPRGIRLDRVERVEQPDVDHPRVASRRALAIAR